MNNLEKTLLIISTIFASAVTATVILTAYNFYESPTLLTFSALSAGITYVFADTAIQVESLK